MTARKGSHRPAGDLQVEKKGEQSPEEAFRGALSQQGDGDEGGEGLGEER